MEVKYSHLIILALATVLAIQYVSKGDIEQELDAIQQRYLKTEKELIEMNERWVIRVDSLNLTVDSLKNNIVANDSVISSLQPTYNPISKTDEQLQDYFNSNYIIN